MGFFGCHHDTNEKKFKPSTITQCFILNMKFIFDRLIFYKGKITMDIVVVI